ncbi:MAG: 4Fe-4S dicluster domain-containing protein [Gammaproteobacteria bacterium]|nr:4Fe-4S dicluster domain-containing protein [Gammaproteobacteria bacterium]
MSAQTPEFVITKKDLLQGLDKALADYQVAALTKKDDRVLYDIIKSPTEVVFDYQPTVLSPKKFFFPQDETILEYTADGKISAKIEAKPTVLFGIRPCDLNGFKILHEAFADDHGDPNYLAKVEQTVVIGIDCEKICDKDAFCFKVGSQDATGGFDLMLYEIADGYAIEIATDKGSQFISKYLTTSKANGDEITSCQAKKAANFGQEKPFKNLAKLPELFEQNKHHAVWDQEGSRCLSCGSCIMVCPTCYCFDVGDEWQLNLKKGERVRKWDACMVTPFAAVGSGENFRHTATYRLHHRINRKFNFLMKKHNQAVCVGCGRCVRACLADISPKRIAEAIGADS